MNSSSNLSVPSSSARSAEAMVGDYDAFRSALREAKHIVVLAGAGLSAASGIPTFRGGGGLWRTFDAMKLATPEAFENNPSRVWQFYHYRREIARAAMPNAAHKAIALLCASPDELAKVAPSAQTLRLVTQNVDNLSTRALPPSAPVSAYPIEMHGNVFRVKCTECGFVELNLDSPICPGLAGTEASLKNDAPEPKIELKDLPKCPKCDALLRPGVVWFGEQIELLEEIAEIMEEQCDLILVVGTSSTVYPAATFADIVEDKGGIVAVFNIEATSADKNANFKFIGPCEETLPKALGVEDRGR
ncbi:DHS-like NAD/FAD-binding domain-containing protein [Pisolithus croceorrhizus]|nr:DHS-like NAD/FAD-binding domain-containing protein [Pisolithus croceorrhizus]